MVECCAAWSPCIVICLPPGVAVRQGPTPQLDQAFGILSESVLGADLDALFEPFYTTREKGSGLGLYIARQLCEANHIRIEHLAPPRGGSCFRLSFPNPKRTRKL